AEEPQAQPLTAAQQARLKERDRYAAETQKYRRAGKLQEAIQAAERMLAIEREVLGNLHVDVVGSLEHLAKLHESREDFPAARKYRQEVLALCKQLHGDKDWRVTDARLILEDVDRLAQLDQESRQQLRQAATLNDQVANLSQQGQFAKALPLAKQV